MSFQVTMRFPGDTYPSIDPLAVQWGTDGAFVWTVRDGIAERTPVRIVQRSSDSVLVVADGLEEGMHVVTEGVHNVREGREVRIARRAGEESREQPADPPSAAIETSGS
jgi:multidrug efflux pump subunit AcrA (membrane-fusion protein)